MNNKSPFIAGLILLNFFILGVAPGRTQTIKWVDPVNGSDTNDGNTEATAYASLQFAIDNTLSGTAATPSLVNVKGGVYDGQILVRDLDHLILRAVSGNPVIRPDSVDVQSMNIRNCTDITIDNIDSDQTIGLQTNFRINDCNDLTVRNCTFVGGKQAINFKTDHDLALIEGNTMMNIDPGSGDEAIDFTDGSFSDITIQDNIFLNNHRHIKFTERDSANVTDIVIRRNYMDGTTAQEAVSLRGVSDVQIVNNIIANSSEQAILILEGSYDINILHNTLYNNGEEEIHTRVSDASIVIKNNIIYGNGTSAPFSANSDSLEGEDFNLIFNNGNDTGLSQPVTKFGTNTMLGQDPLFVSLDPGNEDFHLQDASPAIEAGTPGLGVFEDFEGNQRPQPAGTNPDIGAFETGGVSQLPDITIDPSSHDYGGVPVGDIAGKIFEITNEGALPLDVTAIRLVGPDTDQFLIFSGGSPFMLTPGDTHETVVNFIPTSEGQKSAALQISSNDPDEGALDVALMGNGVIIIEPDISINPSSHNFGTVSIDSSVSQSFVVTNDGNATLDVTIVELIGPDTDQFNIESGGDPFILSPGDSSKVEASFNPTSPGAKSAQLSITSNDSEQNPLVVRFTGRGILEGQLHRFVFLVNEKIKVDRNINSEGDLHANGRINFDNGGPSTHTGNLTAVDDIIIERYNTIDGDVITGANLRLEEDVTITGLALENAEVDSVPLPILPDFSAGSDDFVVLEEDSASLAPGSYDDLEVEKDAVLLLSHDGTTGDYFFDSFIIQRRSILIIDVTNGPVTVNVVRLLRFHKDMEIRIVPYGRDGTRLVTFNSIQTRRLQIQRRVTILGNIIAPEAEVTIDKLLSFKGSICARRINMRHSGTFLPHSSNSALPKHAPVYGEEADEEIELDSADIPDEFALQQNYPNPFNPSTTIRFSLPQSSHVTLTVYNLMGQQVRTLFSGNLTPGHHHITWDATSDIGQKVASGIYVYVLKANDFINRKKLLLMK